MIWKKNKRNEAESSPPTTARQAPLAGRRQAMPPADPPAPASDWPRLVLVFSLRDQVVQPWQQDLDAALGLEHYRIYRVTGVQALERAIQEQPWSACVIDVALANVCGLGKVQVEWLKRFAPPLAYCPQEEAVSEDDQAALVALGYVGFLSEGSSGVLLHEVLEELLENPAPPVSPVPPALRPPPPVPSAPDRTADLPRRRWMPAPPGARSPVPAPATPREGREVSMVRRGAVSVAPRPPQGIILPGGPPAVSELVLACWSAYDTIELDVLALNLGAAFRRLGLRTLVGECRRPSGALVSLLRMDEAQQERSLVRAARASQTNPRYREDYGEFLSTHLLLGQAVPGSAEALHLFISGPPGNGVALLEEGELNPERSRFIPTLLEKAKRIWHVSLLIVGSNVADPLHLEVMRAAKRLLMVLTPETDALERAEALLPGLLAITEHTPDQVDVLLVEADRSLPEPDWQGLARLLNQPGSDPKKLPGAVASWYQAQARRQEEVGRRQQEVHALLKRCGLPALAGVLPDSLPWMRLLRQKSRKELVPLLCHPELATSPYAQAIEALAVAWVHEAQAAGH